MTCFRKYALITIIAMIFCLAAVSGIDAELVSNHFFSPKTPSLGIYQQEFKETQINRNPQLTLAYNLLVDFQFTRAIKILNKVAHDEKLDNKIRGEAYCYLGYAYMNLRETVNCIEALKKSIDFDKNNALAYYFLAHEYYLNGDFKATELYLAEAVKIHPKFISAMRMLAELYKDKGELDKSADLYQKIVELVPNSGYFRYQYYKICLKKQDWDEAEKTLQAMIKLQPKYRTNYLNLGEVYIKQGKLDKALKEFNYILDKTPNNSQAFEGKARILFKKGELDRAEAMAKQSYKSSPDNTSVRSLLMDIQEAKKEELKKNLRTAGFGLAGLAVLGLLAYFIISHRRKQYVISVIQNFNRSLDEIYDIDTLSHFLLHFFLDLGGSGKGIILLFNRQNNELSVKENEGFETEEGKEFQNFNVFAGSEITNWLAHNKKNILTMEDIAKDALFEVVFPSLTERLKNLKLKYIILLKEKGALVAFLALDDFTSPGRIVPYESDMLNTLSTTSAQSLLALSLYEISVTDETTGLFNKRHFMQSLSQEIKRAERYKQPLSLIIADVDNLKRINENYGTERGDMVLRELAEIFKDSIREGIDLVARTGGGQFSVIIPSAGADAGYAAAERLRQAAQNYVFPASTGVSGERMTMSFGTASFPDHAGSSKTLISKAEEALTFAKRTGKNKVFMAEQLLEQPVLMGKDGTGSLEKAQSISPTLLDDSGLYNRAYFNERFTGEIRRSERSSKPCSLILVRADEELSPEDRKEVNHELAKIFRANLRRGIDVPALYDRNTVALLIPESDQHKATVVANRMKILVDNSPAFAGEEEGTRLTFSFGISNYPSLGRTEESFMVAAHQALIMCQQMGGNTVMIASPL